MSEGEISEMMAAAAPHVYRLREIRRDASRPRWAAQFDDDVVVVAEWIQSRRVLALSVDLGYPPEEHIATVQETLLVYNSLRQQTAGASMALAEPAGELVHLFDIDHRDLSAARISEALGGFALESAAWRKVVADGARIDAALAEAAGRALTAAQRH